MVLNKENTTLDDIINSIDFEQLDELKELLEFMKTYHEKLEKLTKKELKDLAKTKYEILRDYLKYSNPKQSYGKVAFYCFLSGSIGTYLVYDGLNGFKYTKTLIEFLQNLF